MTIIESIKVVLSESSEGLTAKEIYNRIVEKDLYAFKAKNPAHVVNSELRRHCYGMDFPTASPNKHFAIAGYDGNKVLFSLYDQNADKIVSKKASSKSSEKLPEEIINDAYSEHYEQIKQQVFDCVLNNSPSFFEHLVMDLLIKMGYGYDSDSGEVTGRSHDGGIDGKISEDKLGLDLIYIQAKRYNKDNSVGSKEMQAFAGAMENVQKGVFITTSKFTKEAVSFVERQQQKSIKLIDGKMLADLLVKYQVGINIIQNIQIYKVDTDYYDV